MYALGELDAQSSKNPPPLSQEEYLMEVIAKASYSVPQDWKEDASHSTRASPVHETIQHFPFHQ